MGTYQPGGPFVCFIFMRTDLITYFSLHTQPHLL